jgi:hypothetical protein
MIDDTVDITEALLDFANNYCNRRVGWTAITAPPAVELFIAKATTFLAQAGADNVQSKRLGDMQVTYSTDFPPALLGLLNPFKQVRFT